MRSDDRAQHRQTHVSSAQFFWSMPPHNDAPESYPAVVQMTWLFGLQLLAGFGLATD
jgi:hypothetical protein